MQEEEPVSYIPHPKAEKMQIHLFALSSSPGYLGNEILSISVFVFTSLRAPFQLEHLVGSKLSSPLEFISMASLDNVLSFFSRCCWKAPRLRQLREKIYFVLQFIMVGKLRLQELQQLVKP